MLRFLGLDDCESSAYITRESLLTFLGSVSRHCLGTSFSIRVTLLLTSILKIMSWAFCALEIACRSLQTEKNAFVISFLAIPYGYGVDLWNIYRDDVIMFLKVLIPQSPYHTSKLTPTKLDLGAFTTYYLGTLFVKLSILLFYLRINPDRTFRILAYSIGAFEITYILISIGIEIFGCSPVARSWDFYIPGNCVNEKDSFYVQAVFNIITDFATLVLPIRMCVRLQLPTRQKWMLGLTFAVGSLYVSPSVPAPSLPLLLSNYY